MNYIFIRAGDRKLVDRYHLPSYDMNKKRGPDEILLTPNSRQIVDNTVTYIPQEKIGLSTGCSEEAIKGPGLYGQAGKAPNPAIAAGKVGADETKVIGQKVPPALEEEVKEKPNPPDQKGNLPEDPKTCCDVQKQIALLMADYKRLESQVNAAKPARKTKKANTFDGQPISRKRTSKIFDNMKTYD